MAGKLTRDPELEAKGEQRKVCRYLYSYRMGRLIVS
jgi:hypothetical protein